ncbi:class I SAM-dependent methyltransferase [Amycolatopsis suaedae]|uniref:Class I SAM-dependent methyltransferase n=1 Tax=Amycolatopsis suaedae TaxID=2510978 RepID=A0A4Q7J8B5_9PSEU|nr:class I SAM-dependent methyltransferase [Amycolatopsis suaedae]RZQ63931.1 class I SAM-dependent methyltransferase [Amycolatopsis suaedae]
MQLKDIQTKAGYDLWASSYEQTPNPVVAVDARHSIGLLAPRAGERILDAGCGTGRNLKPMLAAGALPHGVDFSPGMLAVARRAHPDVPLSEADLEGPLPFAGAEFDAVYCSLLGEHLDHPGRAVAEFFRVLKPGGRLVFSVFHPVLAATGMSAQFESDGEAYKLVAHPYTVDDYAGWITAAGFSTPERHEFSGDDQMVAEVPWASWLVGRPVLLVLTAAKP